MHVCGRRADRVEFLGVLEEWGGARGAENGLLSPPVLAQRRCQPQVAQAEVEHRARGGANVARVEGAHEEDGGEEVGARLGGFEGATLRRRDRTLCLWQHTRTLQR